MLHTQPVADSRPELLRSIQSKPSQSAGMTIQLFLEFQRCVSLCVSRFTNTSATLHCHASGEWMLVANEASGNIVVFKIDAVTGLLTQTTQEEGEMPTAMCLVFVSQEAASL